MNGCGHTSIKGQGDNVDERMGAYEPSLVTDKRSRKGMLIAAFSRSVVWWKSITREWKIVAKESMVSQIIAQLVKL